MTASGPGEQPVALAGALGWQIETGAGASFDEHRITELVRSIVPDDQLVVCATQRQVVDKCSQELVVAGVWLVGAREDHVNDTKVGGRPDSLGGESRAGANT